ncbi:MAG TPA: hypothetical protein VGF16_07445 [Bryobacteraceae bacterium]|jgi:hypothetical protein
MRFDPNAYGADVAEILALDGNGERLMPLAQGSCSSAEAHRRLQTASAAALFPHARQGAAALAGLWLYFSCWNEAHQIAQDIGTREGSYWHAIVHRQEPDAWNARYWFRQAGVHPIFPELHRRAREIGIDLGTRWDPVAFVDLCERARTNPGSDLERQAMRVQTAEWQLLFDYCAGA